MKYLFIRLTNDGETEQVASATVSPEGAVVWEPEDMREPMMHRLSQLGQMDESGDMQPLDLSTAEGWQAVPTVLSGSRFWCEIDDGE